MAVAVHHDVAGATVWCHTILFDVDVPLVTKKRWSALKMRAAFFSDFRKPGRYGPATGQFFPALHVGAYFHRETGGTSGRQGS